MTAATATRTRRPAAEKFDAAEVITNKIIELLEQGVAPWRKEWDGPSGLPKSISSGKSYRGINPFLLWITAMEKNYQSPWWGTYKKIAELGGNVRKGEKGTTITFWKTYPSKTEVDEKGKPKVFRVLRVYSVFNAEQADGLDPKYTAAPDPQAEHEPIEAADAIIARYLDNGGPTVTYGGDRAAYAPTLDALYLPERSSFTSAEAAATTTFHELTHSTGHTSRLNREDLNTFTHFGDAFYAREELVAELGAALLNGHAGISPTTIENSAAYLQGWIKSLKGDSSLILTAAGKAQRAVDHILGTVFEDVTADAA